MTTPTTTETDTAIGRLRAAVRGRVVTPDDADYDTLRTITVGGIDRHPAAIVRVADAADVAAVVRLATELGLDLAVRSGGHSGAGHSSIDDAIVVDVRDLDTLEIDAAGRTAWAGSGLTAAAFTEAAAEHGLATGFGDTGSVGLGGIITGGGVGYLVRAFGLTIDSLLAAEIVTADGRIRLVDAHTEPDLFWAIRGGGGNFGIVTRFRLQLHPLGTVVGGLLVLPATVETIAGFVAAADAAPEGMSTIANVMPCPPLPFVPEDQHGKVVIFALMCHTGSLEDGEAAMAPFRALATPVADMVHPISYPEIYPPEDPDYHPLAISRNLFMDTFGRAEAQTIVEHLDASDAAMRAAQIRVLGGAMSRVPADATAYAHRDRPIMVNIASFYTGPDDRPIREAWVTDFTAALQQGDTAAYVNFIGDEGPERVRDAYPDPTWDRLVAIKTKYDPDNTFHNNQNIPPAATEGAR